MPTGCTLLSMFREMLEPMYTAMTRPLKGAERSSCVHGDVSTWSTLLLLALCGTMMHCTSPWQAASLNAERMPGRLRGASILTAGMMLHSCAHVVGVAVAHCSSTLNFTRFKAKICLSKPSPTSACKC